MHPAILLVACMITLPVHAQHTEIPEPIVPVYNKLKSLYLTTPLVDQSNPSISIMAPPMYAAEARAIQEKIKQITGVTIPVLDDHKIEIPLQGNLILLGNRSTSKAISDLYDRTYTFLDLKYPGAGGFVVRSLHKTAYVLRRTSSRLVGFFTVCAWAIF